MIRCSTTRDEPSKVAAIAAELTERNCQTVGHAGNGILYVSSRSPDDDVRTICNDVAARHNAIVSQAAVDHPADAADILTKRLRQTFDPSSVFGR